MPDVLLRVLLVDDEPDAVEILRNLLVDSGKVSEIEVLTDPLQVECTVQKFKPDVLFLDIKMPQYDGITLLSNIRKYDQRLDVVYVTAYESYIYDAVKLNIFSYLLKPVSRMELNLMLDRISMKIIQTIEKDTQQKVKLPIKDGFVFLNPEEIFLLEADGNYTRIFTIDGDIYISSYNLGRISQRIPGGNFLRINRKQFLNNLYLTQINKRKFLCTVKFNGNEYEYKLSGSFLKSFNKGTL